jgi:uncharacterized membrane protein YccC
MAAPSKKTKGAAIAIFAATGSVVALSAGHVSIPISVVIAILGIGIGAGFAWGMFSKKPDVTKPN